MLAMDVWCFSKSTARIDLEKHQTRLHYWGISLCNFGESPLQFWVFLLYTKQPGLTGMWQVSGRSNITDFEEVVKLDERYIREWNFALDIKIILKTVGNMFSGDGAE